MMIGVLVTDMFEDSEYFKPVKAFEKKGHEIINIGLKKGTVRGKSKGKVKIDVSVNKVYVKDFDALLIPGGFSPDILRAHKEPVEFVKKFFKSGKPVFAICHGPQLLISANVLKGRKVTGWKSIVQDLKNAGAKYKDKKVVVDKNLVTSRYPPDIPAFNKECLKKL